MVVLLIAGTVSAQKTSEKAARKIMGANFISADSALAGWQKYNSSLKPAEISIPYSQATLEKYARENENGGRYFLVPTLGLAKKDLKHFWKLPANSIKSAAKTAATYRLVDMAFPPGTKDEGLTSYQKQLDTIKSAAGEILPMADYLEIIGTLSMLRQTREFSAQLKFFYIGSPIGRDSMEVFSTFLSDTLNEVITMDFPRDSFLTGFIKKDHAYYLTGADYDRMTFSPVNVRGLRPDDEIEFFITAAYDIKP